MAHVRFSEHFKLTYSKKCLVGDIIAVFKCKKRHRGKFLLRTELLVLSFLHELPR